MTAGAAAVCAKTAAKRERARDTLPRMQFRASSARFVVSGASGVLGGAIVRALCENSTRGKVIGTYFRHPDAAQLLHNETGCAVHCMDVCDEKQVETLWREHAPIGALVHAAGVSRDSLMLRTSREDWHATLRVNLESAFLMLRAALQHLPDGGRVVLLASRVGENGARGQSAYAASKAGLIALMKSAVREGAAREIAINAICPAFTVSAMTPIAPEILQQQRARDLFGKLGSAQSTALLARWLLSEEANGISGQVFHADARLD